ncbi:hypothetical protein [Flavobacterium sp.]|uniref:hypothetical protein n=1 Tax=Flavobacterium sp. TaxID=239 RepID=UPI0026156CF1|nr:hypothetical protein [Flavobacterium sp.]
MSKQTKIELNNEESNLETTIYSAFYDEYKAKIIANQSKPAIKIHQITEKLEQMGNKKIAALLVGGLIALPFFPVAIASAACAVMCFGTAAMVLDEYTSIKAHIKMKEEKDQLPKRYIDEILPQQAKLAAGLSAKFGNVSNDDTKSKPISFVPQTNVYNGP